MYLSVAKRPENAFSVNYLSQFLENPEEQHWVAVMRILGYLKGKISFGIQYKADSANVLESYSDEISQVIQGHVGQSAV